MLRRQAENEQKEQRKMDSHSHTHARTHTIYRLSIARTQVLRRQAENEQKEQRKMELLQKKKEELEAAHEENRLKAMARLQV